MINPPEDVHIVAVHNSAVPLKTNHVCVCLGDNDGLRQVKIAMAHEGEEEVTRANLRKRCACFALESNPSSQKKGSEERGTLSRHG